MRFLPMMLSLAVVALLGGLVLGLLPGCINVGGSEPLVKIDGRGYAGGSAQIDPGVIPPGPEHQACRDQLARAIDQINRLQKDLDNCKSDRRKDKDKLEQDKKQLKEERDNYKDRLKRLGEKV